MTNVGKCLERWEPHPLLVGMYSCLAVPETVSQRLKKLKTKAPYKASYSRPKRKHQRAENKAQNRFPYTPVFIRDEQVRR